MERRRRFYEKNRDANYSRLSQEERGEIPDNKVFYTVNDKISLSLEYGLGENQMPICELASTSSGSSRSSIQPTPSTSAENSNSSGSFRSIEQEATASRRYLLAPAGFSIRLLKKYVLCKWDLPNTKYRAQVFYLEDELDDELSLMDIAYIYGWKRMAPLRLFYRFIPRAPRASTLTKLRASQTITCTPSTAEKPVATLHTNQQSMNNLANNQTGHPINRQAAISHPQPVAPHQPVAKKAKLESPALPKPLFFNRGNTNNNVINTNTSNAQLAAALRPPSQPQNRNSPLQAAPMRHSPVQATATRASPVNTSHQIARSSPNIAHNVIHNVAHGLTHNVTSNKQQSMATSSALQQMYNAHLSQQAKVAASTKSAFTPNQNNKLNLGASLKRTISKTKLHGSSQQLSPFDQLNGTNEYETAAKYRKILPASNSAFVVNQQHKSFAQPMVTMPSQLSALNTLSNYQQAQQRKQASLNAKSQLNQLNQIKMNQNVNQMNSNLNSITTALNTLNNINNSLNNYRSLNSGNLLNTNSPTTIASSSTVTSLRNVRVPSTEKKKTLNSNSSISSALSNLSSQNKTANLVPTKYNLSSIPPANKTSSSPKTPFNISHILEGSSSSSNKREHEKPSQLLNLNSMNNLNQFQSALECVNNLNNFPLSPTSSHRRKSFDKSPNSELNSSVTAKGIKIFRNGLLSPTGSSSSGGSLNNSLNSSLNNSNHSASQQMNKSTSLEKKASSAQLNERKSPIANLKLTVGNATTEKSSSPITQFKQQVKCEQPKPEEAKKQATTAATKLSSATSSTTSSSSSLNAAGNASANVSNFPSISQIATLEAVGLSSKAAVNSKKGASLDKIVNKITSNIIGKHASNGSENNGGLSNGLKSLSGNQTPTAKNGTQPNGGISFAQAVNNGLKTAAEQKSSKDSPPPLSDPANDSSSLTIRLPLLNGQTESVVAKPEETAASSPTSKETVSKSLFLNSKIEVTIDEDELPKSENSKTREVETETAPKEQVFSDVEVDVDDDDDSMDGKLVMVIPETENSQNSCSSSVADEKLTTSDKSEQPTNILKQQNQSLCAIQANTPPSSSPDFSKKFPSSRSNSPISSACGDKATTNGTSNADELCKPKHQLTADPPVSPPLTPSPRPIESQTGNRENNFGALDLSTGPRKPIALPTAKLAETV